MPLLAGVGRFVGVPVMSGRQSSLFGFGRPCFGALGELRVTLLTVPRNFFTEVVDLAADRLE